MELSLQVDRLSSNCRALLKHVSTKNSATISDQKMKSSCLDIVRVWHQDLRPQVVRIIPTTDKVYEIDNLVDQLGEYSTKAARTQIVKRDLRALIKRLESNIKIPIIKTQRPESDEGPEDLLINPDNFTNKRKYFVETVRQLNIAYRHYCPDACALLLRKIVEFSLLDYYQQKGRLGEISADGDLKSLKTIINHFIDHSGVRPGQILKDFLQNARLFGGTAAHNARTNLIPDDIKRLASTLEIALRELCDTVYPSKAT